MLELVVPNSEFFDQETGEFITIKGMQLVLEHSLISLSAWESKWQIPFLKPKLVMTQAQNIYYFECMTITKNVNPLLYTFLYKERLSTIYEYIQSPMTATTINSMNSLKSSREIITAEIIYYWMTTFNIPFECQKWHLNRLLTLISVCSLKSAPKKKIPKAELNRRNTDLNGQRLKALNTRG